MENAKYLRVFKMAKIDLQDADRICSFLSKDTLERLTKVGIDRRIIKPILEKANRMQNGITDENINALLDDPNFIISLKMKYCR